MDVSDADFDSYWENESRNNNRNRIRVGRQYQATVPPLLKPGESDGRRLEDLETLRWRPESLSDQSIDEYLSMAKAVSLFARAMDKCQTSEEASDGCLQTALKGLSDFVTSHHGCHHDAGCQVGPSLPSDWTPNEASLFARALDECGKNFSAIKKDFLPWKPVKSLIEYYYQGKLEKQDPPTSLDEPGCSGTVKEEPVKQEKVEEEEAEEEEEDEDDDECGKEGDGPVQTETSPQHEEGPEVKPMRAKPIKPEEPSSATSMGSLKFYLGGRLVLKLSAQEGGAWVESQDTPRLGVPKKPPSDDSEDEEAPKRPRGSSLSISWPETALVQPPGSRAPSSTGAPAQEDSTDDEPDDEPQQSMHRVEAAQSPQAPSSNPSSVSTASTSATASPLNLSVRSWKPEAISPPSTPRRCSTASPKDGPSEKAKEPGWAKTSNPVRSYVPLITRCYQPYFPLPNTEVPLDLSSPVDRFSLDAKRASPSVAPK
ncbi:arginine-glutamic acid dipeptide repeats protein-like isoform X2 [Ornithodoros turicata]|uniref:arginine-glutamic acid dipeptide repeats protein-like isoform X2 n=1 Tax=Ornithodoros turicata TaxID=34597 RepID=UPI003138BF21